MQATQRDIYKAVLVKLFVPALLLLLPLLLLGSNLVEAGPKLPATLPAAQGTGGQAGSAQLVLHVYFRSIAERDRLATQLDALEVPTTSGYLTVISDQAGLDSLRRQGLRVEVDLEQTAGLNTPVKFGNSSDNFFGGYHTVEELYQFMNQEASTYPNLAETVVYGQSWCKAHPGSCTEPDPNNGYDLVAMHITNRSIPGPKPVVWLEGGIHAREIQPPEVAINYIAYLLDNYNSDADVHWLVDWQDIWVIPDVNPDGHHIVEAGGGGQSPYYQRKNANNTNGCNTWPPAIGNQFGTDINRNFPFLWNCCGGSSSDPCAESFHGASANSDDETRAVVSKISQLIPDQRGPNIDDPAPITTTGTFLDMHSFSDVNLYSWDMYNTPAPNEADLKNLAFHLASTNAYPPGDDYTPCQFGHCLYIADGATNDWVYGELGAAAFAEEIGNDFFEPYSTTQNILWPQNKGMMLYLSKVARQPYLMTRGPDATLAAASPMTVTQGLTAELTSTINYAWNYHDGYDNYMQNVAAAEYYLDTPPWAGGTPVAMQPVDGQFDSPVEAVEATIQTGSISVGRHILFIRGRGVNDYEGFHSWGPVTATWLTVQPYASATPTATGTPPTATHTPSRVPTATATATPCYAPAIQNGGFETGNFSPGWTILDTAATPTISMLHTHSGNHSAFLGSVPNNEPYGDSSIYQQITVPAAGGMLSYWYYPYSRDNIQFDWQDAYVTDTNGNILATIMHVLQGTETWTNITYDLAPYAGQTVRIEFLVHQDGAGDVAHMYVDDVLVTGTCPTSVPVTPSPTATNTAPPAATATPTQPAPTGTATSPVLPTPPTATPPVCNIQFRDVPVGSTFYPYIHCLACRGIVNGYPDGTFRPNNQVTRGQLAKLVYCLGPLGPACSQPPPVPEQKFQDVPPVGPGSTYFIYIDWLYTHGFINGYPCGGPNEPCVPPRNLPYYRPNADATRGQISKIVSNVADYSDPPSGQQFEDVAMGSTYYTYTYRLASRNVMSGYPCGSVPNEPCVPPGNLPYFRPNNNATRGQTSKIVSNTFFPDCQPPSVH
jgi:hypothetical protein